jgi:hypothetical protein
MRERELLRDHPTEGLAVDVRPVPPHRIEHGDRVVDERRHRARPRRLVAVAVAAMVDDGDVELGGEPRDVPPPRRDTIARTLEDQQRRRTGLAGEHVVDPASVGARQERHDRG